MATHDYVIANGTGAAVRSDLNDALAAIVSQNSSATAPTTTYAYMPWADTATGLYKIRNAANNNWITLFKLDGTFTDITLSAQGDLRFSDSDSSNWVAFQAPTTVASNVTWTLPAADGTSGQFLSTNGSGTLGWSGTTTTFASTSEVGGTHTTGSVTSGTTSLTVASATGIVAGMYVVGEGIAPGTTVSSIASTTVTLSANANTTLSSDPVAFYIADKSLSPGLVAGQLCRAWVNFNGTSTVAIRASYNVSSITDNGTGDYTVNFTTAMPDANYSVGVGTGLVGSGAGAGPTQLFASGGTLTDVPPTTTSIRITTLNYSGIFADLSRICVAIFR